MSKVVFWFFVVSLIICVVVNIVAFFGEKVLKKKMEKVSKKES